MTWNDPYTYFVVPSTSVAEPPCRQPPLPVSFRVKQPVMSPCCVLVMVSGQVPLYPADKRIVAVASDLPLSNMQIPRVDLNDIAAIADLVLANAEPLTVVLARLTGPLASEST